MSNEVEIVVSSTDKTKAGFSSADSRASKLGATMAKVGKIAAIGLGAALVGAGAAAYSMAKAAIEDEAAQAKLAETLRNNAAATDDQIASVEDWISAQGRALGVTDDELRPALERLVTATGDVGKAQKLASLAMDVSAGTGKSLESVSTALMKAQNGQVSSLSRLGIETTNAKGETLSFEQATKKMADTFGGQAAVKADTLSGKMGRLKLMFDEGKEALGAKLLPVLTAFADWFFAKGIPAVQGFVTVAQAKLGPVVAWITERFRELVDWVRQHWPEIQKTIKQTVDRVSEDVKAFVDLVRRIWRKWGDDISRFTKTYFKGIIDQVRNSLRIVKGIIDVVTGIIKGDWSQVWRGIQEIFGGVFGSIRDILRNVMEQIRNIARTQWDAVKDISKRALDGIRDAVRNAASSVKDAIGNAFDSARDRVTNTLGSIKERVVNTWGSIVEYIRSIPGKLAGVFDNIWSGITGGLRDAVNSALGLPMEFPGWDWPGPGGIGPKTLIPALASGGIVKARPGGTLVAAGDGGVDEAVVPLDGRHNLGGPVVIEIRSGGSRLDDLLVEILRKSIRVKGGDVQVVLGS